MHKSKIIEPYIKYVLILLGVIFIVLLFFLIREIRHLNHSEIINAREVHISNFLKSHGPLSVNNIGIVASWMTFDYINKLFAVPPSYFETTLGISNSRYPQISLSGYARSKGISSAFIVGKVESALQNYLSQKKP
jgi:hypothetical protein